MHILYLTLGTPSVQPEILQGNSPHAHLFFFFLFLFFEKAKYNQHFKYD